MCAISVVFLVVMASCSTEKKHPDYTRMVGKWKEIKNTANGKVGNKADTWYEFKEDQTFESYTGKGYTYKLDTTRHIIKAFGQAMPESDVDKKAFEVLMFEKDYRFSGDTLVLEFVSKTNGVTLDTYYLKEKEE